MVVEYTLNIRHRPDVKDDIFARHNRFLERQIGIGPPWELTTGSENQVKDGGLVSVLKLGRRMGAGVRSGGLQYTYRAESYLENDASKDDCIILKINPEKLDFKKLVLVDFPKLVEAFEAYTAEITVGDYTKHEFDDWRKYCQENCAQRHPIFRISPVGFYDRTTCLEAFNLTPEAIAERLQGHVENVYCQYGGVFIVFSSDLVDRETYLGVDSTIRALLAPAKRSVFDIFRRN